MRRDQLLERLTQLVQLAARGTPADATHQGARDERAEVGHGGGDLLEEVGRGGRFEGEEVCLFFFVNGLVFWLQVGGEVRCG